MQAAQARHIVLPDAVVKYREKRAQVQRQSSRRRRRGLGRAASSLQGCPSGLGWDEALVERRASLRPSTACLRGWLLCFPPGTLDCLCWRGAYSYPGGWLPGFGQCHRERGQLAGTRRASCGPDQHAGRGGPRGVTLEGVLVSLQLPHRLALGQEDLRVDETYPHSLSPVGLRTLR